MISEGKRVVYYIPIRVEAKRERFDLYKMVAQAIRDNGERLEDGDIIVISSKFVSMAEGRLVELKRVHPGPRARRLARKLRMPSRLAELVLREADLVFGGVNGFALALKDGMIAPNSGIDRSNVFPGWAMLHPSAPFEQAERLRIEILSNEGRRVGVVITDSRLMPTRIGTTGVAIGVAGFEPVKDERGKEDLFGNALMFTRRAIADDISAGAQLLMGEADEAVPIVIVRNAGLELTDRPISKGDVAIEQDRCIYVRGLSGRRRLHSIV